jgi:Glyoxalase-like domain
VIAVSDLEAAAHELEGRYGLASVEGGRHPGWGTANRIVPLGDAYLELVSVVDEREAALSAFGRWVEGASKRVRPLGWAVRTQELDDVARRLGLTIGAGSRMDRAGRPLRWRHAGVDRAVTEPSLPFFIQWGDGTPFPGHAPTNHRIGAVRIDELRLAGDADRLAGWLGSHHLPIVLHEGAPAVTGVVLTGSAGAILLDLDDW